MDALIAGFWITILILASKALYANHLENKEERRKRRSAVVGTDIPEHYGE